MDPVVLSFQDSLLRRSDLSLLEGPHWLNDHVIGFAFEFFSSERFKELKDSVVFISPEVTQFIKCSSSEEELSVFLEPLGLSSRSSVFLAVNDNVSASAGGTHWSLLVFVREDNTFYHYDSQSGSNRPHAQEIARRLETFTSGRSRAGFREEPCPAQQNTYDCGMYVMSICEHLCEGLRREDNTRAALTNITPAYVTKKREEWCRIIQDLAFK